jgi:hypothetical protein
MVGNILVLNRWPQYPNSDRWDNELARYSDLICHRRYQVVYICDTLGQQGVTFDGLGGSHIHVVPDFNDFDVVSDLVGTLIRHHGPFDRVVAFSEYLLDLAARLRELYGIPGPRADEVDRFRDKTVMKNILRKAGIRTPRWSLCRDVPQVMADATALGYPLIIKPVRGASSKGVRKIASAAELETVCQSQIVAGFEIEEYIDGEVLHADGVVDENGACLFMSVSRYISPCLDFEAGLPLGSIIQTDPELCGQCRRFALDCLAALGLKSSAFHLEFFRTGDDLVFLEIGARVPGADVSYVIHDVFGVNLFRLWVDVTLGHRVAPSRHQPRDSGGWLTIPRPRPLPRRVIHSTSLLGRVPFLYRELIPHPGQILEDAAGYANLQGGRFLFRGGSEPEIADAIRAAQSSFTLVTVGQA